jgi:two-component system sensor kinase FixL
LSPIRFPAHGAVTASPMAEVLVADMPVQTPQSHLNEWLRRGAWGLILVAIYVGLSQISSLHQYKGLLIRPWNPGLGFMLAVIVLQGPWFGVVLFVGSVSTSIIVRYGVLGWPGMLSAAVIIAGCYTTAAVIAIRYLRLDVALSRLRDVMVLLATAIVATIVVAILMTTMLTALGRLQPADTMPALLRLSVGNILGIAVVAPLVLRLAWRWREGSHWSFIQSSPELVAYALSIVGILWFITGIEVIEEFKYFYLVFLPVIAASIRHGLDGACISLAVTQLTLVALIRHYGYDAAAFTDFQVLMFVLTATGLVVGVVVTEREEIDRTARQAEIRLKEKEAEAQHSARLSLLSGMASSLAHEVNQPMTAARALARTVQHLLRTSPADLARAEGNLTNLIAQIDHASGIVRRTRDFLSRPHPRTSTLDLRAVIDDALALIRSDAQRRHIDIAVDLSDPLPPVHGDRVQLQQVILNLIRNAIDSITDAFPTPGRIALSVRHTDTQILVSVSDNGAGVLEEIAERLFQPLTTSKSDGLGLGLSICASIVDAHGGKIWLESGKRGATEFRFSLPLETTRHTAA